MPEKENSSEVPSKAIFEIETAEQFFQKLIADYEDFKSNPDSTRHALNTIMTGYHLHEWVWGDKLKKNPALSKQLKLKDHDIGGFIKWITTKYPEFEMIQHITNGSKHFARLDSGKHQGAFSNDFSPEFDISYLYILDKSGKEVRADDLIKNLMGFWEGFFSSYLR